MRNLVFATANPHKLDEIRSILPEHQIFGLKDLDIEYDIPETGQTLKDNALIKANYLFNLTGTPSFSEDTGLEVDCLNGEPGVHTARYGGDERDSDKNMDKLLKNMEGEKNRKARFRTVIAFKTADKTLFFEGMAEGHIAIIKSGNQGFGYDPVFIPNGYDVTFADLNKAIKNKISHRAKAVHSLIQYLNQNPSTRQDPQ